SASPELMAKMPTAYAPMGITAENVANRFGISRKEQDEFALWSQQKASAALEKGVFKDEIVEVHGIRYKNGERVMVPFSRDELPRPETTLEGLGSLKPSFAIGGSVTPGNASPLSDGAAAALVMTREKANELGIKPLGIFRSFTTAGVDPALMGIGPVPAVRKLLARNGLTIAGVDVIEMTEAFSSQALYCKRGLGLPDAKLHFYRGANSLGVSL